MKSALVFLSVIALSCALTFGTGKQVTINDDGTLTILGENGKKIVISNAIGGTGPKDIEISINGPYGAVKKISVNGETNERTISLVEPSLSEQYNTDEEDRAKRSSSTKDKKDSKNSKDTKEYKGKEGKSKTQAQLLQEIFSEHQEATDAKSYGELLTKVDYYVKSGQLSAGVYDVIRSLRDFNNGVTQYGNQQPLRNPGYPVDTTVPSYYQSPEQYPYPSYSPYGYGYNNYNNLGGYGGAYGVNQGLYPSGISATPANPWSNMWSSLAQQKIAGKSYTPSTDKTY
uniref:Uncharacterized protein LOC114330458 n=1 Tax=Diabrotica virgifera virgifera TaxID=50390 RepID=A0A6P7FHL8_DIAVI